MAASATFIATWMTSLDFSLYSELSDLNARMIWMQVTYGMLGGLALFFLGATGLLVAIDRGEHVAEVIATRIAAATGPSSEPKGEEQASEDK